MACRIPFTMAVLFVLSCSLINDVWSAASFEYSSEKEGPRQRRDAIESEEAIFYCAEVDFPEDIICDMTNITSSKDEWKDLVPQLDGQLVLINGSVSITYKFTGGEKLKTFEYQYVNLYPADYEPPTRDVKMDEFPTLYMDIVKFPCTMSVTFIGKISGNLGNEKHSSLLKYKFKNPDSYFCAGFLFGREVKDFFKTPCAHDGRRCRPTKESMSGRI